MPDSPTPLRLLSKSEFEQLTREQRMEYILRMLAYLSEKLDETRRQAEATNRAISD